MKEGSIDTHNVRIYDPLLTLVDQWPGPSVKQKFGKQIHLSEHDLLLVGKVVSKNGFLDGVERRFGGSISDLEKVAREDMDD